MLGSVVLASSNIHAGRIKTIRRGDPRKACQTKLCESAGLSLPGLRSPILWIRPSLLNPTGIYSNQWEVKEEKPRHGVHHIFRFKYMPVSMYVHMYMYMHTYITYLHTYTYIHTCMHACIHTYIHTYIQSYAGTYTHYLQMHIYTYIYLSLCFIYLFTYTYMYTCVCISLCVYVYMYIHIPE